MGAYVCPLHNSQLTKEQNVRRLKYFKLPHFPECLNLSARLAAHAVDTVGNLLKTWTFLKPPYEIGSIMARQTIGIDLNISGSTTRQLPPGLTIEKRQIEIDSSTSSEGRILYTLRYHRQSPKWRKSPCPRLPTQSEVHMFHLRGIWNTGSSELSLR